MHYFAEITWLQVQDARKQRIISRSGDGTVPSHKKHHDSTVEKLSGTLTQRPCITRCDIFQMGHFLTKKRSKGDQFSGKGVLGDLWIVKPALTHIAGFLTKN